MSLDITTYALAKKYTDKKVGEVSGGSAIDLNIENGTGVKSIQQVLDVDFWNTTNEAIQMYVGEGIAGENNGALIKGTVNEDNTVTIQVGAFGKLSSMEGGKSQAMGGKSHAEGSKNVALENNSHVEGNETFAAGAHSHAEGNGSTAIGNSAHAEGVKTLAKTDYSHAEGNNTKATGNSAHAQNFYTEATGEYSHAEGNTCKATNSMAHAEGYQTMATGYAAHSQGGRTKATGAYTLAGGFENIASADYQTVIGKANKDEADKLFIIGNGTINDDYTVDNDKRSNALTVDKNGNVVIGGDLTVNFGGITHTISSLLSRIIELEDKLKDM